MKPIKNPCHQCAQRTVTCHHDCKKYIRFDFYRRWIRAVRFREQGARSALVDNAIRKKLKK